ncbi:hypothetical protein BD408DRAFT_104720 [Parasitella parasitica]|nr:hypothetical protein BD408DRAFT_104720 [Parasitella parasitica]
MTYVINNNMDQLPKESLLRIISYLAISEKLNLAATCKRLKHLVMNSDLYKNLVLRGDRSFYDFKEYFENYKEYQRQVRNLQLRFMFIEPSVVLALPKQFVNLREIGWISEDSFEEVAVNEQAAQHWKNITRFKEHSPSFISAGILEQDGFCNLIELDVEICDNCDSLICQLSKAPKLKILRLKHFEITLLALDQLQCNAQQLEVLNLRNFRVSRRTQSRAFSISSLQIRASRSLGNRHSYSRTRLG